MDSHEQMRGKLAVVMPVTVWCALLLFCLLVSASDIQVNIRAEPGQTVSLPCQALSNVPIIAVQWSRSDLKPDYVLLYRDDRPDPEIQHPSFRNRVELKDKQMKDGDVSLIVENLVISDTGTYECRVIQRSNRFMLDTDPITTIKLTVTDLGPDAGRSEGGGDKDEYVGLLVGLSVVALLVGVVGVVSVVMYRKRKGLKEETSYKARDDKDTDHQ
ncbi:Butyrophilin subfamily 2 member A1 Precursor [Channa argus]|uniref:Butyrophilin subfamily 2 member A1 n=1 Tax=Channa argus TaxID=215402 RepID=A0A6G1Q6Q6_CHAAH|nr:Butyrophilin subfamily 2 member A1 Precursor [Channa argus]